jgi:hypothetical protein
MPAIFVYRNGQWREAQGLYPRNANAWKTGNKAWVRSGGQWRLVFERLVEITLSSNTGALVVAPNTLPGTSGIVAGQTLRINVPAGVVIRGGNANDIALTIQGWPTGVSIQLHVDGALIGAGGFGGFGAGYDPALNNESNPVRHATDGSPGGTALVLRAGCTLSGSGRISGGGGGGGGGGAQVGANGGGGGGGGSATGGIVGVGGLPGPYYRLVENNGSVARRAAAGQSGGRPAGGVGGVGGFRNPGSLPIYGGTGRTGGAAGSVGGSPTEWAPGDPGSPFDLGPDDGYATFVPGIVQLVGSPGQGGAAGAAIDGASRVTNLGSTSVSLVGPRIN